MFKHLFGGSACNAFVHQLKEPVVGAFKPARHANTAGFRHLPRKRCGKCRIKPDISPPFEFKASRDNLIAHLRNKTGRHRFIDKVYACERQVSFVRKLWANCQKRLCRIDDILCRWHLKRAYVRKLYITKRAFPPIAPARHDEFNPFSGTPKPRHEIIALNYIEILIPIYSLV